jgi:flagellar biosynthesis protein FlhG
MKDQARTLRRLAWLARQQEREQKQTQHDKSSQPSRRVKILSITSGKGGVGKTNVVVNLAYTLHRLGARVMIFDADLGLANIDVLLGIAPRFNIQHVIEGEKNLQDVLIDVTEGMMILPVGSGRHDLLNLPEDQRLSLLNEFTALELNLDFLLIDTGAGISTNVMSFNTLAHDIIVVVTPEPTSLTDAYTLMKVLAKHYDETHFKIVVNAASDAAEAKQAFRRINKVTERFLNITIEYLGFIFHDPMFTKAVRKQQPLVTLYPHSESAHCFYNLAQSVIELPDSSCPQDNLDLFWNQLLNGTSQRIA